ncbi:MAG: class I SAM-dependent methyltransferase [Candidatus Geothermarchaeales archaeon]
MTEEQFTLSRKLTDIDPEFAEIIKRIPPRTESQLPPDWLHSEIIERHEVLSHATIEKGMNVLEVGSGQHAIATVPLAHMVGDTGRVTAVEIERWKYFDEVMRATGLGKRVIPLASDATQLPFPFECFDLAVIVHGIRSMRSEKTITRIISEMLRVSPRVFLTESLPIAKTRAQEAHLEMYNLREEIFEALLGAKDDIHYLPLGKLADLVERAGGRVIESKILDVGFPHYLAFIPREYVERIRDEEKRESLLRRWQVAHEKLLEHSEEHPPVAIVNAVRGEE